MHRGRAKVQRVVQQFESAAPIGSPFGGVGDGKLRVVAALDQPETELRGVADPDVGFTEQLLHKHPDVFLRNPRAAETCINLGRGEVRRLHGLQRLGVAKIFFIDQRRRFGGQ